ncbi:MAG: hypothetical protein AAGA17_11390 [Actinomycetota bacterium]
MSPQLSLLLAAGIVVVGTGLVLAWNRWNTSRQADGITTFAREMQALAPDRPARAERTSTDPRRQPPPDGAVEGDGSGRPPRSGGVTPGA